MPSEETKQALQKDVDDMLKEIKENAEKRIAEDLSALREKLEQNFKSGFWAVIIAAFSLAVAIFIGGIYTQRTSVNQAVIDLQKDVVSAQKVILESSDRVKAAQESLAETSSKLKAASDELQTLKSEYERQISALKG
jgi:anti-sigma-K factor RskA